MVEFFHSDGDVMGEDEIEEELLFGRELAVDILSRSRRGLRG